METAEDLVPTGIVRAETITKGIRASRHLDPAELKRAWEFVTDALARAEPDRLREFEKTVYAQHIGLMGVTRQSQMCVVNTRLPEDIPSDDLIFQHKNGIMTLAQETYLLDNKL